MDEIVLYSVEEITAILKVTQRTLYNYIKSGSLKAIKVGKYWRIKHQDFQNFIDNGTGEQYAQSSSVRVSARN
ncbi:MAG: helix-turn-helix domain-containing protein [Candidatus Izemoplasmatales bacterium]|nr:helix-turn-helix domain-containing protein [bacterium]MDZ4197306.1 helix-turn-helix domain-containing protein [Candidatus Izemoplasmatales bacterium]